MTDNSPLCGRYGRNESDKDWATIIKQLTEELQKAESYLKNAPSRTTPAPVRRHAAYQTAPVHSTATPPATHCPKQGPKAEDITSFNITMK